MITIYHNPRCSKSRAALTLVQDFSAANQLKMAIIDYQQTPLTLEQLTTLRKQLGRPVHEMVRDNEEQYAMLDLQQADEATLLQALAEHPKLLQRPIVVYRNQAVIGRPPERLHELFKKK